MCACIRERNPGVVARASSRAVCFVSRDRANAAVRLSRFAVWRFEALWECWWHVGALVV